MRLLWTRGSRRGAGIPCVLASLVRVPLRFAKGTVAGRAKAGIMHSTL